MTNFRVGLLACCFANGRILARLLVVVLCLFEAGAGVRTSAQSQDPFDSEIRNIRALNDKGDHRQAETRARALLERVQAPDVPLTRLASAIDVLMESVLADGSDAKLGTGAGGAAETLALAKRAVEVNLEAFGPDDSRTAYSSANLGLVLTRRLDFAAATATLQEALRIQERALGPDDVTTARTLLALGGVLRATGDFRESRAHIERALNVFEKTLNPEDVRIALALLSLGTTLDRLGQSQEAFKHEERAAAMIRKAWGPDHPRLAQIVGNLAWAMDQAGQFQKSEELHREAIGLFERSLGNEHPDLAWELNNYGLLHWRTGDYEGGRPLFERALAIWTKVDSPDASRALNNLAITFRRMGDLAGARAHYDRSLAIKEKAYGPDHPEVALVLFNTANLLKEMGDHADARRLYERALRIREEKLGRTHTLTAYALIGLGDALMRAGRHAAAKAHFDRAVTIWQGLNVADVAVGLTALGDLSRETRNFGAALSSYDRARAVYEQTFGADYPDVAILHNSAASVLFSQGKYHEARERYLHALTRFETRFGLDYPSISEVATGLANVQWRLGETAQALSLALRAERISREHFRLTSRTLSEREAINFSATRAPALDLLMTIAVDEHSTEHVRSVADTVVRARALVLDEVSRRNQSRPSGQSELSGYVDRLTQARSRLANLQVRGPGTNPGEYAAAMTRARLDRDAAERQLAAMAAEFRDQVVRDRAGLDEVLRSVPTDAAVVSFVKYEHLSRPGAGRPSAAASKAEAAEPRYVALLFRGGSADVTVVPLGPATTIDALVNRWRQEMIRVARVGSGFRVEAAYRRSAGALARAVWNPVASHLSGAGRVFLVPDGSLNLVSFAALPDGQNDYLIETGPLLHYLSAERDLVAPVEPAASRGGLLVVGNPAYNQRRAVASTTQTKPAITTAATAAALRGATADCPEFQRVRFGPLASTLGEVDDIAALWGAEGSKMLRLTGDEATESAFKRSAPQSRIIHLATHGFFLGSCGESGPGVRGVGGLVASPARARDPENPLLLSGLALAGANRRGTAGPDEDDGILTAEEVASLDLHAVEWAVLSACDTGVGEVRAGEGVFGLRRAFASAGVRTTIMSLWSVGDRSTREWMKALYEARLSRGRSTAEALQDAGRAVLRSRRERKLDTHPYFWAAFVAAGESR